jgi:homeobox protein cut-like
VYRNLNPLEKIVYSLTRAVLTNRYSRNAFFVYCVGLHLLVILVLYWLATIEHVASVGTLGTRSRDD